MLTSHTYTLTPASQQHRCYNGMFTTPAAACVCLCVMVSSDVTYSLSVISRGGGGDELLLSLCAQPMVVDVTQLIAGVDCLRCYTSGMYHRYTTEIAYIEC
jgi:hypothetical protein